MAAVAASDVTYTLQEGSQAYTHDSKFQATFKLIFGAGLTYPSGGIPLTKAKLGCPNTITDLGLSDDGSGSGYIFKYDYTNAKLRIYISDAVAASNHTHNILVIGGSATATATTAPAMPAASSGG